MAFCMQGHQQPTTLLTRVHSKNPFRCFRTEFHIAHTGLKPSVSLRVTLNS